MALVVLWWLLLQLLLGFGLLWCLVLLLLYYFLGLWLRVSWFDLLWCELWFVVWYRILVGLWVGAYCVISVVRLALGCGMVRFTSVIWCVLIVLLFASGCRVCDFGLLFVGLLDFCCLFGLMIWLFTYTCGCWLLTV